MGIKSKQIKQLGFSDNVACSLIVNTISKYCKHSNDEEIIRLLSAVKVNPENYWDDAVWGKLALHIAPRPTADVGHDYQLKDQPAAYEVFGREEIEDMAFRQMDMAMRLPIAVSGALMPDAHAGYGLPIGGVLATDGVVIPYAVGLDIGCRMQLTVFDADESFIRRYADQIERALLENTHFGMDGGLNIRQDHDVMHRPEFREISLLHRLKDKARRQLGSSGCGNHFVEVGVADFPEQNILGIAGGKHVALLSHSGSRGLGAEIARHFSDIAREQCRLPREAGNFAWLDMASHEGQAYWMAMNLAADYAEACHELIHYRMGKSLGLKRLCAIGNHHNMAWQENHGNRSVVVHRKGATPAMKGVVGIIPGSMGTGGYIVEGLGCDQSLQSASHGAGRCMSRQDARNSITWSALGRQLQTAGVRLIGGSLEEAPTAYKDIDAVMAQQSHLVRTVGRFMPSIVRMNKE